MGSKIRDAVKITASSSEEFAKLAEIREKLSEGVCEKLEVISFGFGACVVLTYKKTYGDESIFVPFTPSLIERSKGSESKVLNVSTTVGGVTYFARIPFSTEIPDLRFCDMLQQEVKNV